MNKEEKLKLRELYLSANADQRHILEEFYPELKDSEGERIRKALLDEIKTMNAHYGLFNDVPKDKFIAWLEQQGEQTDIINNQLDCVDLGLPSGTLWCEHNLGAEKETDFGPFFQWGDTQGYSSVNVHQFNWYNYKWGTGDNLTKYNSTDEWTQLLVLKSNKLVLDNEDDPVWAATDGKMKSPTKEQLQELRDHANHEWTEIDGVKGMKFVNKNDSTKYIFIPAAGYCIGPGYDGVGSWGFLWSSSRDSDDPKYAWRLCFDSWNIGMYNTYRCLGYSVRGVINR